jgi:hypothetical protein
MTKEMWLKKLVGETMDSAWWAIITGLFFKILFGFHFTIGGWVVFLGLIFVICLVKAWMEAPPMPVDK